ncbi:MAG: transcription antitermination factor NusB [Clostridiales bacterium]|nr:transcription antitermination factor NusB [Clostridiales bacterium]
MSRHDARIATMRTLYSQQFKKDNPEGPYYSYLNVNADDKQMSRDLIVGVNENIELINIDIESHLKKWKAERLPKVDVAILQMAIYEIKYQKLNPPGAVINEAVELAKEFSLPDSGSYINAILASVLKSVQE